MSMKSSFAEQFGQQVQIRAVDPVSGGTSVRVNLKPEPSFAATVTFARTLMRRGVKGSVARHVAEQLVMGRPATVEIPHYEGLPFQEELSLLGVRVTEPRKLAGDDLAALRKRLKLSQEQFANSVGLDVPTMLLIKLIEQCPRLVQRVAADDPSVSEAERLMAG
jgi:hypothetical protein